MIGKQAGKTAAFFSSAGAFKAFLITLYVILLFVLIQTVPENVHFSKYFFECFCLSC